MQRVNPQGPTIILVCAVLPSLVDGLVDGLVPLVSAVHTQTRFDTSAGLPIWTREARPKGELQGCSESIPETPPFVP